MKTDVAIIGAGPVGLLLARLLRQRGVEVLVLEKTASAPLWSQAIGVTPPSLEILDTLGLADAFVSRGVPIHECEVHGEHGRAGIVSFRQVGGDFPFVLSLPQTVTMELLAHADVPVIRETEIVGMRQDREGVTLHGECGLEVRASRVAACDGSRSRVRGLLGVRTNGKSYGCQFTMGDFHDRSGLGRTAHVFFTSQGAVESFPLPGGLRRWIVQAKDGLIPALVRQRTGFLIEAADQIDQHHFSPRRLDCARLHHGRVVLCGDAAHVMSPIGGQGMNCGFGDAAMLAHVWSGEASIEDYDRQRRRVAAHAASRAALGMWLGTRTGRWNCLWRDALFRALSWPLAARHAGAWFAMKNLPAT
jgi:2-polyprenyl-6-methoxyphenol hydroxylase-like FAD-dependent oxidoreductase